MAASLIDVGSDFNIPGAAILNERSLSVIKQNLC